MKNSNLSEEVRRTAEGFFAKIPQVNSVTQAGSVTFSLPPVADSEYQTAIIIKVSTSSGSNPSQLCMLDSANTFLIYPHYEDISNDVGPGKIYTLIQEGVKEGWGSPGNIVQGPISINDFTIEGCVFFACTGNNRSGGRTANCGIGVINPWSSNGWAASVTPAMQSPFSYTDYPYLEIDLQDSKSSTLTLSMQPPANYSFTFPVEANYAWPSSSAFGLQIGNQFLTWSGLANSGRGPVAFIDTGGTQLLLSDLAQSFNPGGQTV